MEITKREVLASVSIIAVLLLTGFLISGKISQHAMDQYEEYNKAVKIEDQSLFEYGMRTDLGNAFVYGTLKAADPVRYSEIPGKYMYLKKVKERYTKHTRRVKHTSGKRTYYTTETYWTWDYVNETTKKSKQVYFLNNLFEASKINIPGSDYITTLKKSSRIRYVYYGTKESYKGTLYTKLKNHTISNKSTFYANHTISETVDQLESGFGLVLFWICWIVFMGLCVYGFYYLDNEWLE